MTRPRSAQASTEPIAQGARHAIAAMINSQVMGNPNGPATVSSVTCGGMV